MKKILITLFAAATAISSYGQCRTFVKNNCGEAMGEYVPGENFNAAKLLSGDEAEMKMTFNSGQDYRLLVCTHDILGDVQFSVVDDRGNVLHDNSENGYEPAFDFRVAGTQELIVKIQIPESSSNLNPQGCVAILVGRKKEFN